MEYRNPTPTVDIIIELDGRGIVLIERLKQPLGYALPGGFVDEGESLEHAAMREAKEETDLDVELLELLYVYSNPTRDPRQHTMSTVFIARAHGTPRAMDDAAAVHIFNMNEVPKHLCFDHAEIIEDYVRFRLHGERPRPSVKHARHG